MKLTHEEIDLTKYSERVKQLAELLSVSDRKFHPKSIMEYGKICHHDDGWLCECRLKFILDYFS